MNLFRRKKHTMQDEVAWLNDELVIRDDLIREQNTYILELMERIRVLEEERRELRKEIKIDSIIHERNRKG